MMKVIHTQPYGLHIYGHILRNSPQFYTCLTISPLVICKLLTKPIYSTQAGKSDMISTLIAHAKISGENF